MNIYIFGSQDFKKDIHSELEHANIKFRLGEHGVIEDVQTVGELKELIAYNNEDVYLIDDAKIIKNNILQSKIKFLQPKDGIEEAYLKDHGIGDISVDSISDVSKHIIKKLKDAGIEEEFDEFEERDEIQESISDIVQEAYDEEEKSSDEERVSYELDDDLESLLSKVEDSDSLQNLDDFEEIKEEFEYSNNIEEGFAPDDVDEKLDIDFNLEDEESLKTQAFVSTEVSEGVRMADDFLSLDDLTESDIQAALNGEDIPLKKAEVLEHLDTKTSEEKAEALSITLDKAEDLSQLLTKLLDSKTLEITVKVKD